MDAGQFQDKIVHITGASGGIGGHLAQMFESKGAKIVLHYYNNEARVDEVISGFNDPGAHLKVQANLRSFESVKRMYEVITSRYDRLDILINNAGIFSDAFIGKMDIDQWVRVIDVNLNGVFYCTNLAIPIMRTKSYGKIINISSVVGEIGVIGSANYAASKAGVIGFTKALARENLKAGITIYGIALGYINTGMLLKLPDEIQQQILAGIPMGRFGSPEEVKEVVSFLCSNKSDYLSGQIINLNGGLYL